VPSVENYIVKIDGSIRHSSRGAGTNVGATLSNQGSIPQPNKV